MNVSIIHRKDLKRLDVVFYCTSSYSFTHNWVAWDHQDSCEYHEIDKTDIVFGCIKDGIFHYVD